VETSPIATAPQQDAPDGVGRRAWSDVSDRRETAAEVAYAFFYGTLMTGFDRRRRAGIENRMSVVGRGSIQGALYDLGIYPAAVPAADGHVWGEVYRLHEPDPVLAVLDEIEGYAATDPDRSLYVRALVPVTLVGGRQLKAWAYFYNAPLGQAPRIASGDYLDYVRVR
jgi:gamma-glutamylcyclotransferase (GGCT)/AIG2-like uncharacterized protein YtfP